MSKFLIIILIILNLQNLFALNLPSHPEKYLKFGMDREGGFEDDRQNRNDRYYYTIEKRLRSMLFYKNGLFVDYKQIPVHTFRDFMLGDYNIEQERFVMDEYGNIFLNLSGQNVKHSFFLAGKPVAAAGWMQIIHGKLTNMFVDSGHYRPNFIQNLQIVIELLKRGVKEFTLSIFWGKFLGSNFTEIKQTDLSKYLKIYYAS